MRSKSLMLQMMTVSHFYRHKCGSVFNENGITRGQPPILDYLSGHDGCIQRDLAEHGHTDPASVTSVLSGMESAGLIERRPDADDRRALRVFLTEKGKEAVRLVESVHARLDKISFDGFSEEEQNNLSDYIGRIRKNLRREGKKADDTTV